MRTTVRNSKSNIIKCYPHGWCVRLCHPHVWCVCLLCALLARLVRLLLCAHLCILPSTLHNATYINMQCILLNHATLDIIRQFYWHQTSKQNPPQSPRQLCYEICILDCWIPYVWKNLENAPRE